MDLRKKLNIQSNKYNNVLIYNVLEHIDNHSNTFKEIKRIINKIANLFGSTPFLYQVHGAPKDYFRFTKDFFMEKLKINGFKKIKIKCLGFGPFVACFSITNHSLYCENLHYLILLIVLSTRFYYSYLLELNLMKFIQLEFFFLQKNK